MAWLFRQSIVSNYLVGGFRAAPAARFFSRGVLRQDEAMSSSESVKTKNIVCGMNLRVADTLAPARGGVFELPIPSQLWQALKQRGLLDERVPALSD